MLGRSTMIALLLGFVGTVAGCGGSSTGASPDKDSGQDARPTDKDVKVAPEDADASRTGDSGPDVASGKKDAASEAMPDAAHDLVDRRDLEAEAAAWKDTPPSPDAPADRTVVSDGGARDALPVIDGARLVDVPAKADGDPGADSNLSPTCQGILFDNTFMPPTYPVLYHEPTDAAETFATRSAALLSAYGLDEGAYTFKPMPISWTAEVEQGTGPCTLSLGGPLTKETTLATAQAFLSRWGALY